MRPIARNGACLALGVSTGFLLNRTMNWQDRPLAMIGVAVGVATYLLALLILKDIQDWRRPRPLKARSGKRARRRL